MEKRSLTAREFEGLVRDAVKSLPREFKRKLENINIVILEEPSARQKKESGTGAGEDLLGLYEGIPLAERTHHDGSVLPATYHALLSQPASDTDGDPRVRALFRNLG